ncbi:kvs-1 [Pristionchus pacificus]|uniref:Kvs-1 n=1 Tax=Pristionchus pacificus TaxID=54126 RepID=A0A2A6BJT5_PRIPA|nr:kvs-1 [Pristionchus pacificus]|eukprot:PDM66086.1 kvs-1 [Pristionchus pacificus]
MLSASAFRRPSHSRASSITTLFEPMGGGGGRMGGSTRDISATMDDNETSLISSANSSLMVIPSTRKNQHGSGAGVHNHFRSSQLGNHHHHSHDDYARQHLPENGRPAPRTDLVSGTGDAVLKLNIGGSPFRLKVSSIFLRGDEGRLVKFAQLDHEKRVAASDAYFMQSDEYYFERSALLFDAVFKYYATGQLHRPLDVCTHEYSQELSFWKIPENHMSPCCWRNMSESMEDLTNDGQKIEPADRSMRHRIHVFCEGDGSLASTIFSFASISFVLISVIGLVLGSIHELQVPISKNGTIHVRVAENETTKSDPNIIWEPHPVFGHIETICILWFTFEYILRIAVAPSRIHFLCGIMNIVDLIAIVPFFLEQALALFGIDIASLSDIKGALLVVRVLRVLRVVRILKLGRYSSGMRTFALTLKSSARQLGMMGMVLSTGVVFFSTLLYFVEKDEKDTPFTSIPAAFWWAIVTMTTVGYGDCVPVTIPGKLIASGAIISGVLVLALPITIIVDNFMKVSGKVYCDPNARPVIPTFEFQDEFEF